MGDGVPHFWESWRGTLIVMKWIVDSKFVIIHFREFQNLISCYSSTFFDLGGGVKIMKATF